MWPENDDEVLKKNAFKICQDYLEGAWQKISIDDFIFYVVRGGLSNRLYYCSLPDDLKAKNASNCRFANEALLRIFGPLQDKLELIVREATVFTMLSEKDLGPKLYGIFCDGRLEEYIPSVSLTRLDLRRNSTGIAKELAKVHCLNVPIIKHPDILSELADSWICYVEENINKDKSMENICNFITSKDYHHEMRWFRQYLDGKEWPVVFCHNDLQGGNILLRDDKLEDDQRALLLIDFEFGCYNYRGFDIANHFCEWCFNYNTKDFPYFETDLSLFPSKDEQIEFIDAYLGEVNKQTSCFAEQGDMDMERENILYEIMVFRMASSLLWCIWALKMGLSSNIKFSFLEYGKCRWETYKKHKDEFYRWTLVNEGNSRNHDKQKSHDLD